MRIEKVIEYAIKSGYKDIRYLGMWKYYDIFEPKESEDKFLILIDKGEIYSITEKDKILKIKKSIENKEYEKIPEKGKIFEIPDNILITFTQNNVEIQATEEEFEKSIETFKEMKSNREKNKRNRVRKYAKEKGFEDIRYLTNWEGYEVYEPIIDGENITSIRPMLNILLRLGEMRMSTVDETAYIIDTMIKREEDQKYY